MRFANRLCIAMVVTAMGVLAGCATISPAPSPRTPAPASVAGPARSEQPPVPKAALQRFEAALNSLEGGRLAEAEDALRALTRSHPELPGPYANLGILYFRQDKLVPAIEMLERAVELGPSQAVFFNQLGIVRRHAGEFDKARKAYDKALDLDPVYADAHLNLGILYDLYLWKPDAALRHYKQYLDLQKNGDDKVQKWVVDLARRQSTGNRASVKEGE